VVVRATTSTVLADSRLRHIKGLFPSCGTTVIAVDGVRTVSDYSGKFHNIKKQFIPDSDIMCTAHTALIHISL